MTDEEEDEMDMLLFGRLLSEEERMNIKTWVAGGDGIAE